jgi:hypothetical protein
MDTDMTMGMDILKKLKMKCGGKGFLRYNQYTLNWFYLLSLELHGQTPCSLVHL